MGRPLTTFSISALAFFAGLTVSFFTLPLWVVFAINVAKDGARSDWLGFSGSVVGGAVTLIAAITAWFAVQRQIKAQEQAEQRALERAAKRLEIAQGGAKYAAAIVLTQTVHAAAAVMNVTEQLLEAAAGGCGTESCGSSRICTTKVLPRQSEARQGYGAAQGNNEPFRSGRGLEGPRDLRQGKLPYHHLDAAYGRERL